MRAAGGHHGTLCLNVLVRVGRYGTTMPVVHDAPPTTREWASALCHTRRGPRQGRHRGCHACDAPSAGHDPSATVLGAHTVGETPPHAGDLPMGWTPARG